MLTLILQTQEGQQIELNVQPEDTFADLKKQYEDTDGLSESLEKLITNGASVEENTKIFDYVTNSAHEWFSADQAQDVSSSQIMDLETRIKECCAQGCLNSEIVTPDKTFFPLPTDNERLSLCLIEIGRSDLYNQIIGSESDNHEKYFLCSDHFDENSSILPFVVEQPVVSLLKPKNARIQLETNKENFEIRSENLTKKSSELGETEIDDFQHPGILCRLCGETTANPIRLYEDNEENFDCSIADKINLCLPVTVTITDPLPKQICQNCQIKLNACHELAVSSLKTEDKLTHLLREKKFCIDNSLNNQCPLCLEGDMKILKKSGIYRKEDFKNNIENFNDSKNSQNSPIFENFDDYKIFHDTPNSDLLPTPDREFFCSLCNEKLSSIKFIKTHKCSNEKNFYNCIICKNTNFSYPQELEIHYRNHGITEEKFICELCEFTCEKLEEATKHVKKCKPEFCQINCELCDKKFPNKYFLNNHNCEKISLNFHLPEVIFSSEFEKKSKKRETLKYNCNYCKKQFTRKGTLEKHLSIFHDESIENSNSTKCYKCKICNEAFASKTEAEEHIKIHHISDSIINSIPENLKIEEIRISNLYICEYCERCYTKPSSLHDHRESHIEMFYSCRECNEKFDTYKNLSMHKNHLSHNKNFDLSSLKKFFLCKYCDKSFLHYSTLTSHENQHSTILPYLCRPCNLSFENYKDIAKHRDIIHPYQSELNENKNFSYKCKYCEKLFSHEVLLVKHTRMHTGERPHKCTICGKGFSQSSGLYTHMKIHSDLRPYNCTKCSKTFKIKGDRDNHVKKHSGNRPYKCEFCSKAFMTQHVYSQHRRIHTNERPYKCDICGEAFRRSYVLTVHMRRHTGEKPHCCDICPKTYRQRGDLVKHRKSQHGVNSKTEISFTKNIDENSYENFNNENEICDEKNLLLNL